LRVIVEIPQDDPYSAIREALLAALKTEDRDKLKQHGEVVLAQPIKLRLTGFGFYDAFHAVLHYNPAKPGKCGFTKAQALQRGRNHGTCLVGTLWELHPTWKLEILSSL